MVSVSGGTLNLARQARPGPRGRFLNSQVSTENSYRFTYGMAAARVKFPTRRGQHGGFWLQSPTYATYPGRPSVAGAEIDIAEFFGKGYTGGGLGNYLYYRNSSKKDVKSGGIWPAAQKLIARGDTWWSAYHVFSVNWTPQSYTFYVDGRQLYHSTRALSHTERVPGAQPAELGLGAEVLRQAVPADHEGRLGARLAALGRISHGPRGTTARGGGGSHRRPRAPRRPLASGAGPRRGHPPPRGPAPAVPGW